MRTYLIEPQTVFVPYLQRVLAAAGLEVVATSQVVDSRDIGSHEPAAVFVDIDFLDRNIPSEICKIRDAARSATVIALSEREDVVFHASCVISGASAVCSKSNVEERFVQALRQAIVRGTRPARVAP